MVLVQCRITCGLGFPQATQKPIIKQSNQPAYLVLYGEIGSKVGQCSQSSGSSTGQGLWRPIFHLYIAALLPLSALPSAFLPLLCPHRALQEPLHSTALQRFGQCLDTVSHGKEPGLRLPWRSPQSARAGSPFRWELRKRSNN